jgi:hypothetical protein
MTKLLGLTIVGAFIAVLIATVGAPLLAQSTADRPTYTASGELQRPDGYKEWVFLSSGLGMTYGPNQPAAGQPRFFTNVFVNPASYRAFMTSGRWPDQTMFVLEIRRSAQSASIDNGGQSQGDRVTIEVEVKDSARFKETGGWGFFDFSGTGGQVLPAASPLAGTASCYQCHRTNTAVENTFVQFYPDLMEVARRMGTVKPTYDPNHKVTQ